MKTKTLTTEVEILRDGLVKAKELIGNSIPYIDAEDVNGVLEILNKTIKQADAIKVRPDDLDKIEPARTERLEHS